MSELFRMKYTTARTSNGTNRGMMGRGATASGGTSANEKKICAAIHTATVGADKLKRTRTPRRDVRWLHREIMRLSSATTIVAAAGPNISTAAKTNVSDTERRAGIVGTLIVNEPLNRVSPAHTNHSGPTGEFARVYKE